MNNTNNSNSDSNSESGGDSNGNDQSSCTIQTARAQTCKIIPNQAA